jgi:cytochrome c553
MRSFTKYLLISSVVVAVTAFAGSAMAANATAGKAKSAACAGCHGVDGKSSLPNTPNLAGQKEAYLIKSTKDYRDGKRTDAMMNSFTSGLSDADIADLAAFYASLK